MNLRDRSTGEGAKGGPWSRPTVGFGAVVLAASVLAGCGVPLQDSADPLPSGALPSPTTPTASPLGRSQLIYFVNGRNLDPVKEIVVDRSANGIMAAIAAGPPPDRAAQLRTLLLDPLTGAPVLTVTSISPSGLVTFMSTPAFAQLPANDQILLLGQIALSLEEIGLSSISVTDAAGAPLALPLPDGRALIGPATANDYRGLVSP